MRAPDNWMVPGIYKFSGEDSKSTMEHISLSHTQMGEDSTLDFMKVYWFPLSLTSIGFSWFTSLPSCSFSSRDQLEIKNHEHFTIEVMK